MCGRAPPLTACRMLSSSSLLMRRLCLAISITGKIFFLYLPGERTFEGYTALLLLLQACPQSAHIISAQEQGHEHQGDGR